MANVQLKNTDPLDSIKAQKRKKQALLKERVAQHATEQGLLLVRVEDIPKADEKGSTLTKRQKQWLRTTPYDSVTQNPVAYRYAKELSKPTERALEKEEAHLAVQSLSDDIPNIAPSGIADRINNRRRERHQQLVLDMEEELGVICSDLEDRIKEAADAVHSNLAANDKVIEGLFSRVSPNEVLQKLTLSDLEKMWIKVASQSPIREAHIQQLDDTLHTVERERAELTGAVLRKYSEQMKHAASLLAEDVDRLVESKGVAISMDILTNKRTYVQLCTQLRTADCYHERQQHGKWCSLVEDWRQLLFKTTFDSFSQFMENKAIAAPKEMDRLKEELAVEHMEVGLKRKELIDQLLELKPPHITTAFVYKWREAVDKLYADLDTVSNHFLLKLQQCLDYTQHLCEDEMERLRKHLIGSGAYDSHIAYELMCKNFLPLIDKHSKKLREELQCLEKSMDSIISTQKEHFANIFRFVQDAALLWDNQKVAVEQLRKNYQENLEKMRSNHDSANQNLEANLDLVLDRLRQGANPEVLKRHLSEAMRMLNVIRNSYNTFHNAMQRESKKLPATLMPELDSYDSALCLHLGVVKQDSMLSQKGRMSKTSSRNKQSSPSMHKTPSRAFSKKSSSALLVAEKLVIMVSSTSVRKKPRGEEGGDGGRTDSEKVPEEDEDRENSVSYLIKAESFQKKPSEEKNLSPKRKGRKQSDMVFMTQDEDVESRCQILQETENLLLPGSTIKEVMNQIRINFLQHMESWKRDCIKSAAQTVKDKGEEFKTELDLRLHLHEPRASRITKDIFEVRTTELAVHAERMHRHVKGVVAAIEDHRESTQKLSTDLTEKSEAFTSVMATLKFDSVQNGRQLDKLKSKAKDIAEKQLNTIEGLVEKYQKSSDSRLQELSNSNDSYRESLKLFREGGNYCPEEVENFSKKMERINVKMASTRSCIAKEIADLKKEHENILIDTMNNFMQSFHIFLRDIEFSELLSQNMVSLQVSIQSEVAASDTEAKKLAADVEEAKDLLSEATMKKMASPALQDKLNKLSSSLYKRAEFLFCCDSIFKTEQEEEQSNKKQAAGSGTPKVNFDTNTPISAVNVSKNILETTGNTKRKATDVEAGYEVGEDRVVHSSLGQRRPSKLAPSHSSRKRQSVSAVERREFIANFGTAGGHKPICFLPKVRAHLRSKFGDVLDSAEAYYNERVQLKDTPDNPIVHLNTDSLKATFDECIIEVEEKLQTIYARMEEYRRDCIDGFFGLVQGVVPMLQEYAVLVWQEFGEKQRDEIKGVWHTEEHKLLEALAENHKERASHDTALQPSLGRPDREGELTQLSEREEARHTKAVATIAEHCQTMKEKLKKRRAGFLAEQSKILKTLLHVMDGFIYPSEVTGLRPKPKLSTEEFLRQQVHTKTTRLSVPRASLPLSTKPPTSGKPQQKKIKSKPITNKLVQWPMLPQMKVWSPVGGKKTQGGVVVGDMLKEKPTSKKSTPVHEEVLRYRDLIFEDFVSEGQTLMQQAGQLESREEAEKKRIENWRTSVTQLKQLYNHNPI